MCRGAGPSFFPLQIPFIIFFVRLRGVWGWFARVSPIRRARAQWFRRVFRFCRADRSRPSACPTGGRVEHAANKKPPRPAPWRADRLTVSSR